ncbi:Mitochondrial intermediate peptidase [Bachmanniomyces sp. S44760]|nr:Mitochondrial intermediate peptidase [Bachmanniomyces sp. S44760]
MDLPKLFALPSAYECSQVLCDYDRYRDGNRSTGFETFAQDTLKKCREVVARALQASTVDEYRALATDLDRLSDLLCRVIDLADFVRNTHPSPEFQNAGTRAYSIMFEYMNVLNTTTGLNEQLKKALSMPEVVSTWTEEEKLVVQILMKDFSRSAIDFPDNIRERFVELSNKISLLGTDIVEKKERATSEIKLDAHKLKGMHPLMVKQLVRRRDKVFLPTSGPAVVTALTVVEDEPTRTEIYKNSRTASARQVNNVDHMLKLRAQLAELSGFPSYSVMSLEDKMAGSPSAVTKFLEALSHKNGTRMQQQSEEMLPLVEADYAAGKRSWPSLRAWDMDYYRNILVGRLMSTSRKPDFLPAYFSLGTVMQGFSRLFTRLYGVRFVPREASPGETWSPDVRRIDVVDETEGHIAVLYCDLFSRPGKSPDPAHFTVRCSRRISPFEIAEAIQFTASSSSPSRLANDGMSTYTSPSTGFTYQTPTIALICDFSPPPSSSTPTLLSYVDLTTLFHEMGHAIHSILGRTALQNVSGTRCATDFAELPSVLMEHFATDPSVLGLFARHYETDAPLPYSMIADQIAQARVGQASEIESQIILAMLDQACHSEIALSPTFCSTHTLHEILAKWGSVSEPAGTSWQAFFGHLVGYGGSYYSYLFDRAIAGRVWSGVFNAGREGGAVSREAGEKYKNEVLKWGGSRGPWRCVAGVLGDERLAEGGETAMEEVGRWGVAD